MIHAISYAGLVRSAITIRHVVSMRFDDNPRRGESFAEATQPARFSHMLEWRGESYALACELLQLSERLNALLHESAVELHESEASEVEWEERAETIGLELFGMILRTIFSTPRANDPMRLAVALAKHTAAVEFGEMLGLVSETYGLPRADLLTLEAGRRDREAAAANAFAIKVAGVSAEKEGVFYDLVFRNGHGAELSRERTAITKKGDAYVAARQRAYELGLAGPAA
jgi:hypothetical protein